MWVACRGLVVAFALTASTIALGAEPFIFDGCTSFPDAAVSRLCCLLHDQLYWWQPEGWTRAMSDMAMSACSTAMDNPLVSLVMALGVVPFGWLFWRRGRRGDLKKMPALLAAFLEQTKRGKVNWKELRDVARKDDPTV